MNNEFKFNESKGLNTKNIKVATVTETTGDQSRTLDLGDIELLPTSNPVRCTAEVYEVNVATGQETQNSIANCDQNTRIHCKITVEPGASFKSITKAFLRIPNHSGDLEDFAVFPANANNMVEAAMTPCNYMDYERDASGNVTYRLIDISDFIKTNEAQTFYIAIQARYGRTCAVYTSPASVNVMYVESDDFISNAAKVEKSIGSVGNYNADIRSGKLMYNQKLFSAKGSRLPFNLTMSYHALDCANSSPCEIETGMKGWTFNYNQFLQDIMDLRDDLIGIMYMDGGHLYHKFEPSKNSSTVMHDTSAKSGLVLNGNTIVDGKNTTLTFTNKKLTSISVNKGTPINTTITYNSNGKIESVTDGLGDTYTFEYNESGITIKKDGTCLVELTIENELVTQVKYCLSNETTSFGYNDNSELISVFDSASCDMVSFDYSSTHMIKSIKHYVKKVDISADGGFITTPTEAFFIDYNGSYSKVKFCRATDQMSQAYKMMQFQFAEDGELITSSETTDTGFSGTRFRTKAEFEKYSAAVYPNYKAEAIFSDGNGNTSVGVQLSTSSLTESKSKDSETFEVNNTNGETDNFIMSVFTSVSNSGCAIDETAKSIEVQLLEGSTVLGTIYVNPSQRDLQVNALPIRLSRTTHSLKFRVKINNTQATVTFRNLRIVPVAHGAVIECVNVSTGEATYTEHNGSSTQTWHVNKRCSLKYNDATTISDVKFTEKDYMLTLVSKNANSSSFNVWYNDGADMLYGVSSLAISWTGTFVNFDNIIIGTTSSIPGKQRYTYAYKNSSYPLILRQVTDIGSSGFMKEDKFNSYNLLVMSTDENGVSVSNTYNTYGEPTLNKTHVGTGITKIEQTNSYDSRGNLVKETEKRLLTSYSREYAYDADDVLVEETMPNGQSQTFEYSADNEKLTKIESVLGDVNQQTLDNQIVYEGNLISALMHNGTTFTFTYDNRNNVSSVVINNAMSFNKNITYNTDGTMIIETTYGNGQKVKKYYDKYGRLIKISTINSNNEESTIEAYMYSDAEFTEEITDPESPMLQRSAASMLRAVWSASSGYTTYVYDELGRLKKLDKGSFAIETTAMDMYGRPTSNVRSGTSFETVTNSMTYKNAVTDVITNETTSSNCGTINSTFTYDSLLRPIKSQEMVEANGHYKEYTYYKTQNKMPKPGPLNPIIPILPKSGEASPMAEDYIITTSGTTNYISSVSHYNVVGGTATLEKTESIDYDANGNIVSYGNNSYVYDGLGRIIRENNADLDKTIIWNYDKGGNIVGKTEHAYTTGTVGEATTIDAYSYGNASWKDQLTAFNGQAITYDNVGNPLTYKGKTFTWTRGRLLAGSSMSGGMHITMSYDGNGQRRNKTLYLSSNTTLRSTGYIYDGSNLLYETSFIAGASIPTIITRTYLYNKDGVCGYIDNNALYTYRKNLFGDIVAIYLGATKMAEYAYDAYGNCTIVSQQAGVGTNNPFRYRGYYWDSDLGLYCLQTRYYDPATGRFINADSVEKIDPSVLCGLNLFLSNADDQTNFTVVSTGLYNQVTKAQSQPLKVIAKNIVKLSRTEEEPTDNTSYIVTGTAYSQKLINNNFIGSCLGNVSLTTTVTKRELKAGDTFVITGNDGITQYGFDYGPGSIYVSDNIGVGFDQKVGHVLQVGAAVSLTEGVSISVGVNINNTTQEASINVGWGTTILLASAYAIACMPVPGARVVSLFLAFASLFTL